MLKNTPKKWIEDEHIHQGRLGKVNCAAIISDAAHYIRVHLAAGIQPQLGIHRDRPNVRIAVGHLRFVEDSPAYTKAVEGVVKRGIEMRRELVSTAHRNVPPIVPGVY